MEIIIDEKKEMFEGKKERLKGVNKYWYIIKTNNNNLKLIRTTQLRITDNILAYFMVGKRSEAWELYEKYKKKYGYPI